MTEIPKDLYRNLKDKATKSIGIVGSYIIICIAIIYVYYQIYLASKDEKAFTKNFVYNIITIIVPIIFILGLIVFTSFEKDIRSFFIMGSAVICAIVFFVFYFLKTKISKYIFNDYLLYAIIGLSILIGLSIIFTIFSGTLRKLSGITGFFFNLLFYIPCLIRDFIKEVIQEYNTSSTTLLLLFVFELLLIIMYFLVIPLINDKSFPEKTVIIEDPQMLNTELSVCNKINDKTTTNFSISMWIYLNSMSNSKKSYTEETDIFNYSDTSKKNPHIRISYLNSERGSNDFIMYVGPEKFNISLPLQKWNNFVINYVTYEAPKTTLSPSQKEIYANADVYEGEMKTDRAKRLKHGQGKYTYANGDIYDGAWSENEKNGLGKFTYAHGAIEEGKWVANDQVAFFIYETRTGNFSGKGTIQDDNGTYEGDFIDGKKHGYGKMIYKDNNNEKTGYWKDDVYQGDDSENLIQSDDSDTASKKYSADIFINGILERSYTFKNNEIPIFEKTDIMTIGSGEIGQKFQSDGLYGAICNIVQYKKPLSQLAIIYNYNLLSVKNPPI